MASEVKADKLSPSAGTNLTLGDASDTVIVPTGATLNIVDGLGVAGGGTGLTGFTAGDVLYATGTTTLAKLAKGTAEQVLAMNTGATAPDWGSVDLTVLPTITAVKGGTGQTSFTVGDIFYANSTTTITKLAKGTGLQGLQTNSGATAPQWADSPQSLMTAQGDILYASGANTLAKLAKGTGSDTLKMNSGATAPEWVTVAAASSDYVKIAATNATGSAAVLTVDNCFDDTTYVDYTITWDNVSFLTGGNSQIYMRLLDASGSILSGSDYRSVTQWGWKNASTTSNGVGGVYGGTYWYIHYDQIGQYDTNYQPFIGKMFLSQPQSTTWKTQGIWECVSESSGGTMVIINTGTGIYQPSPIAHRGISMYTVSGANFHTDSTMTVYGRKY